MKANLRPDLGQRVRQGLNRWSGLPAVELLGRCLGAMAAGFVLAGASADGMWLPLSVSLAAALGLGLPSFGAYAGGCLGYVVFWDASAALEPMAAGLLVEACLCIFGDQLREKDRWFLPASAAVFTALAGFLFLLEQRFAAAMVWRWLLRTALAGGGTLCFQRALERGDQMCRLAVLACLTAGLCAIRPVGMPLGLIAAGMLSAAALDTAMALPAAALCGLALDLSWGEGCATAVLTLGALVCRGMPWLAGLAAWLGCVLLGVLLTGTSSLLLAGAILGAALSRLLPAEVLFGAAPAVRRREDQRLQAAAGLLDQLSRCLEPSKAPKADAESAAVFDQAADQVCRMCSLWDDCWGHNALDTVEALNRAAPGMMARGMAVREDLPPLFLNRCRHVESFLGAVNRELDDLSCRRQCRSRIRESRRVLARQYGVLAQALGRETQEPEPACRFRPEVGFRCLGRGGDVLSGDKGSTFRLGRFFYLLLCDGMGTGTGAAAEAGAALSILRTLLQAGTDPGEAMALLNGIYILRDDGGFATVDLVQADLISGQAVLYKWGSAPSYLKRKQELEKIGTASPPPGLGAEEAYGPEETKLSLAKGELLVLISDGAGNETAERFMRQYTGASPKELAAGIISCSQTQEEDDRSAAVLSLRPRYA